MAKQKIKKKRKATARIAVARVGGPMRDKKKYSRKKKHKKGG